MVSTIAVRAPTPTLPARPWLALPVGFLLGLGLGVLARLWMRLITDDPEFSWSGTLFIVLAFGVFGSAQGLSWAARRSGWRRRGVSVARIGAVVLTLPIFTGAGSIMLPTVLTAALACWRTDWPRFVRAIAGVLALPVAAFVITEIAGEFGWGAHGLAGIAGFLGIYGVVVAALQPTAAPLDDGWRLARRGRVVLILAGLALAALAAASLRGV
jgi:hypothetical protein